MEVLKEPLYDERDLKRDREYFLKKLCLPETEFDELMALPVKRHDNYKSDLKLRRFLKLGRRILKA